MFILRWDCSKHPKTLKEISNQSRFLTAEDYKAVKNLLLDVIKREVIYLDTYAIVIYTHKHSDENDLQIKIYLKEDN